MNGHHIKRRTVLTAIAATLLVTPLVTTSTVTAQAASVKPSASVLKKSNSYYRKHAKALGKQYKFAYSAQTALKKNGKAVVWVNTKDTKLKQSVKLAMDYWNHKLGKKKFTQGTKKNHTLTFSVSNAKPSKNDTSDAWWTPGTKKVQVRKYYYDQTTQDIGEAMTTHLNNAFYKKYAATVEAKAKALLASQGVATTDKDYTQKFNETASNVETSLPAYQTLETQVAAVRNSVAEQGRMYEYASTIAHEFGHVMGLNHSPNKTDLMYFESGTSRVNSYSQVTSKTGLKTYNPVTATDKARAQLALKIYVAKQK